MKCNYVILRSKGTRRGQRAGWQRATKQANLTWTHPDRTLCRAGGDPSASHPSPRADQGLHDHLQHVRVRFSAKDPNATRWEDRAPSAPRSWPPTATLSGGLRQNWRGEVGNFGRARGAGPGPGGTWFAAGRGPLDTPTGGGGRAPIRPEENFATALYLLMEWCVKSPRTDGVADDRTRWPKRRWGWPSCGLTMRSAWKYGVPPHRPMALFRRGRPTPRALPD